MSDPGEWLREHARVLRGEILALWAAYRDPRTPWYARVIAGLVVAYALSPIDLIPDFVPLLGYLDDLLLVPLGIALSLRLIPAEVMRDAKWQAAAQTGPANVKGWQGVLLVIGIWVIGLSLIGLIVWRLVH
mgnify:CR=1 FL=1